MANFGPVPGLHVWKFTQKFLHAPQHREARFAPRVMSHILTGENDFQPIVEQVDGIDYDPVDNDLRFAETPMLQFDTIRVGFKRRAHSWGHPIATEDFHRTQANYQALLPGLAAKSWARFRDRVFLYNIDAKRVVASPGSTSTTEETLPESNRYAVMKADGFGYLDLEALKFANLYFKNREIYSINGTMEVPLCAAPPTQIQALLDVTQITSSDYNTVKALVRGEVNTYMGFEFQFNKAGQGLTTHASKSTERSKDAGGTQVLFKNGERSVKLTATAGYAAVNSGPEKIFFGYPSKAFAGGIIPRAGWVNVWQNPNRNGTWEYSFKDSLAYKRCQNEYMLVMYGKKATDPGKAIRSLPIRNVKYASNFHADGTSWTYAQTAA